MESKKQSSGTDTSAVKSNTDKNFSPATTATISPTATNEAANQSGSNVEAGETNKSSKSFLKNLFIAMVIIIALLAGIYFLTSKSGSLMNALTGNSTDKNTTDIPTLAPNNPTENPIEETTEKEEKFSNTTELNKLTTIVIKDDEKNTTLKEQAKLVETVENNYDQIIKKGTLKTDDVENETEAGFTNENIDKNDSANRIENATDKVVNKNAEIIKNDGVTSPGYLNKMINTFGRLNNLKDKFRKDIETD